MPPKRKAAKSSTAVAQETDFSGLKIADLKAECTKRGLEGKGIKAICRPDGDLLAKAKSTNFTLYTQPR